MTHVQTDSSLSRPPVTAINMHYYNGPCSNRLFTISSTYHCYQYALLQWPMFKQTLHYLVHLSLPSICIITMAHVQIDSSLSRPPITAINKHYYNGPCSNRLFTISSTYHCHQYALLQWTMFKQTLHYLVHLSLPSVCIITMAHVQIDSSLSRPPITANNMHYYNGSCSNKLFTISSTYHCHQYALLQWPMFK